MTKRLTCPECGSDEFTQQRSMIYDESVVAKFNSRGEVDDEFIEDSECSGEDSAQAYECKQCGWELVDEDGEPITEPDEIVARFEQAAKIKDAPTHIREAFQDFLECDTDTVDVDGVEVGLEWFVERLTGCTCILPAGYCSDLDIPQGSTYGDAIEKLTKEASK